MPLYEIYHSYPLETSQRTALAEAITHLHSRTFTTPSIFVNVQFKACDATDGSYYVAGQPRITAINRILANVRVGSSRSKKDFDELAAKIEDAWFEVINGEMIEEGKEKGKRKGEVDETDRDREAKQLLFVLFYPMTAIRERGMVIPDAGGEKAFYEEYMPFIGRQVNEKGDKEFEAMVEEMGKRDDLKKLVGGEDALTKMLEKASLSDVLKKDEKKKDEKK